MSISCVMRSTALRILPARSPISAGPHAVFQLDQPPGVAVDDGHRRAEFVRRHGDEIALQQRQPLLLRQLLLQHRGLARQHALARHQLDGIVAKHHGGLRHLADLVAPLGFRDIDIGVVGGKPAHAVGEIAAAGRRWSG